MPCLSGAGWQVGAWADRVPATNVRDGRACSAGSLLAGGREHGGRVGQDAGSTGGKEQQELVQGKPGTCMQRLQHTSSQKTTASTIKYHEYGTDPDMENLLLGCAGLRV